MDYAVGETRKCQEITIPMCKGIGYNYTYMPNQFNHETQDEAGLEVHQFWPLVEIQCSPDLKFFLCSMYTPICMENYKKPLPACKSVCLRAKHGCAPLMAQYGFAWPERMNCENLPEYGDKDQLCMDRNATERSQGSADSGTEHSGSDKNKLPDSSRDRDKTASGSSFIGIGNSNNKYIPDVSDADIVPPIEGFSPSLRKDCSCKCRLVKLEEPSGYYNKISTGGLKNCAVNCTSPYFDNEEIKFANFWIGLWSILCCISTSMTVLTFLIDMQRFKYPERPIIFLSGCYFMVSLGYIIRLIVGHEGVACDKDMVRYETTGPATCTVVFLLIYFFGMASSIWWVILTFTWFLSAGLKWGQEAIAGYSQYFHCAAWLIPSIKSIAILAMSSVDGDPISGVCYVGNQSITNLRAFVLTPLFVYLILGTSFLLAGFVSLFRIRNVIKQQGRGKTDKLEKLMIRLGVFSLLYTVPATIVIGCIFYEQHLRDRWEKTIICPCTEDAAKPDYSVFMLKYFMCLVVGITSGFWIWTGKTVDSWKKLFSGKLCCKKSTYTRPSIKYMNPTCANNKPMPMSLV
ncbi:hypothetical protein CHS0354_040554 [Potamilus streckersoni]|uniref:Uncharacterized protein n=1 Tax=Potamilus streckersoni TaxID=2493646 RepID=A0AAE0VWI7_9BIVA|nr:hypothetical protein CHS0354_040554 [Potamilus streckersoni]